jgi:hypothetical protein
VCLYELEELDDDTALATRLAALADIYSFSDKPFPLDNCSHSHPICDMLLTPKILLVVFVYAPYCTFA